MLSNASAGVVRLIMKSSFTYDVVVVDKTNGDQRKTLFISPNKEMQPILYIFYKLGENVALVRDRASQSVAVNFIAFIDDECLIYTIKFEEYDYRMP